MAKTRSEFHPPKLLAQAVARIFGRQIPLLEKRSLIKRGKPVASTYSKRRPT